MEQVSVEAAAGYGQVILQTLLSGLLAGLVAAAVNMVIGYLMKRKDKLLAQKMGYVDPGQFVPDAVLELLARVSAVDVSAEDCRRELKSLYRVAMPYVCGSQGLAQSWEALEKAEDLPKAALAFRDALAEALEQKVKAGTPVG